MSSFEFISLAVWVGVVALQLADLTLTASRVPQLSSFSVLRDDLMDATAARLSPEQLADFRERLATLDEREAARTVPPSRGVNAHLFTGVPWQLAAVSLSLLPVVAAVMGDPSNAAVVLVGLLLPAISYVLALAVARASIAAAGARSSLHSQQRAEISDLLDLAAKASRQKVAGLGDRVARALQILREQQAERP
ncbi:hypothetical protein QMG83_05975 [Salinibacterium sp. G-O1]|uniref:hypothetical protein n=1 Tax=Salinibacterium sp. G-O1 TaxID=3046208 RepID=UPI0024BA8A0C|nr:hypothetical protein [Salinibacterium sp. G-O1]MDJ0334768.1 hypothetical protein [Salinibacterium sp. G-O1]